MNPEIKYFFRILFFRKYFQPIDVPGTLRHIHMINNGKLYNGPKVLTDEMHVKTNMFDLQIL